MPIIRFRVTEKEKELIEKFASIHKQTITDFIKQSVIERVENEMDIEAIKEYEKSEKTTIRFEDAVNCLQ